MKVNACFEKMIDGRRTCIVAHNIELPKLIKDDTNIRKIVMKEKPPGLHWKLTGWKIAEEKK